MSHRFSMKTLILLIGALLLVFGASLDIATINIGTKGTQDTTPTNYSETNGNNANYHGNGTANGQSIGPYCAELERLFGSRVMRNISIYGERRNVTVMWGARAPNRAAAALLVAALRHKLGFQGIWLRSGVRTLCELARSIPPLHYDDRQYDELIVHVGAEWAGREENCEELKNPCSDAMDICGAAGARLYAIGPPAGPMTLRLHARLSNAASTDPVCADANTWTFYTNPSILAHCDFRYHVPAGLQVANVTWQISSNCSSPPRACIPVLVPPDWGDNYATALELAKQIEQSHLPLRVVPLTNDSTLRLLIPNLNSSLLFLDYNLWVNDETNRSLLVQTRTELKCVEALRVGDTRLFRLYAPSLYDVVSQLSVNNQNINDVLQREATGLTIEEAACAHAVENLSNFNHWSTPYSRRTFWIHVLICSHMSKIEYNPIYEVVGEFLKENYFNKGFAIRINRSFINCYDAHNLTRKLLVIEKEPKFTELLGAVALGEGGPAAAYHVKMAGTPLVLFDVPPDAAELGYAVRTAAGRVEPLARATRHFFQNNGWRRIAVILDNTRLSEDFANQLEVDELILEKWLLHTTHPTDLKKILLQIIDLNGRVVFVNTGAAAAKLVLCTALGMGLTPDKGYAWVVREWHDPEDSCQLKDSVMRHFVVSYWWRGGNDSVLPDEARRGVALRQRLNSIKQWNGGVWPPLAAPLVDSMLLLANFAVTGLLAHPSLRHDLHAIETVRLFSETYTKIPEPVAGVVQDLRQSSFTLDEPLVFVEEWSGSELDLLSVWRVKANHVVHFRDLKQAYASSPPTDGTSRCLTPTGPGFEQKCHDGAWIFAAVVVLVMPVALWAARRARLARLATRDRALHVRLLARCERTAEVLAGHLIDRSALELHEELGTGHFGRVRLGMLKLPHRPVTSVAVKALREDAVPAEEAEFLREACALAGLAHAHVVRLAGVCAADGPPLLLMEHAFFGDLLRYLRERRHFAELQLDVFSQKAGVEAEAAHVSPTELTRLAREASAALAYLARERVVHRDVRAANCLVDHLRALKLADFGMARTTGSKAAGVLGREQDDYKYICQRRGVFPVPWMAPESLRRGVFSSQSDVWALGVLMLEIATLGARPFGAWQPSRVLRYVREGGHPPLPHDGTYHMCEVIEMCWRLAPDSRPSASAVQEYLAVQPTALRPALRPAWPAQETEDNGQGDSGFGERDAQLECDPHVSTM